MTTGTFHEITLIAEGIPPGVATVRALSCSEGLSRLYRVEVDLDLPVGDIDPRSLLLAGAEVVVVEPSRGVVQRRFGGVITHTREHAGHDEERTHMEVTIEPALALLALTTDYRLFQDKTTQEIAEVLLDEAGITAREARITGSYPKREVCTQAGEDNLAFLSRILEEDGIYYFFEHREEGPLLVLADSRSAHPPLTPSDQVVFRTASGLVSGQAITKMVERASAAPVKVTLRDHDFKRPSLDLEASVERRGALGREHYEYPGRYVDPSEGARRARLRLDAIACEAAFVAGEGTVFSLTPGHTLVVAGARDASLDRGWLVTSVAHTWIAGSDHVTYHNRFELLPDDVTYRPRQRAARPRMFGAELARVAGPSGEEIHCDEHGRVKVSFFWDRRSSGDDKSSAWVRVGQMCSSGAVAIPRVGWEVLVEFEGGDPDRPIIAGRLYDGAHPPPYALPGGKTMSALKSLSSPGGGGHNEVRLEDAAGGEHIHIHAQRDLNLNVANNKTEDIKTNALLSVGANESRTVGGDESLDVAAQSTLTVGASQSWSVSGARTKSVSGGEKVTVKGSRSLSIGGSHTTMTPMTVSHTTPAALSETVGGSCVEVAALGVSYAAAGVASFSVGGSMIEAVATGKSDTTLGARATTVGGAFIAASGKDVAVNVGGAKATTVGGAWAADAAGEVLVASGAAVNITVGGAVAMNAGSIVLKVGGSSVTVAAGQVVLKATDIKLTATGPHAELAPMVEDI